VATCKFTKLDANGLKILTSKYAPYLELQIKSFDQIQILFSVEEIEEEAPNLLCHKLHLRLLRVGWLSNPSVCFASLLYEFYSS
jgi:hypothetical protein